MKQGWGAKKKALFTLFYGTTRPAEKAAYEFVKKHYGEPGDKGVCVCYGVCEDGYVIVDSKAVSTFIEYQGFVNTYVAKFDNEVERHHSTSSKASAGFAVKDGELKAAPGAEQMYVPFIRTNNLDVAETNWMVSAYSDGAVETNEFSWAADGESYKEVPLELGGRLTNVNDKAILVLLNTNQVAVASNSVTCAAIPANSAAFPYLPYAIDEPVVGEWTVDASFIESSRDDVAGKRAAVAAKLADYDAATNALSEAAAEYDSATNLVAEALAASNTTYAVYTNAQAIADAAISTYESATNAVAAAEAQYGVESEQYQSATNTAAGVKTSMDNAVSERDAAEKDYVDMVSILKDRQSVAEEKTAALGQATADRDSAAGALETAESDLASAEEGFFLVVNGGIIWDDDLRKFNETVFGSANFKSWCNANKVVPVYLDAAEPGTGASLFSYNVASNGNSGATFMSMNGLSAKQGEEYAAQAEADAKELFGGRGATALPNTFQIAFVRADGSVAGFLAPYFDADGKCDLDENLARLGELVEQVADGAEAANDLPDEPENWAKAGLPTIAFGGETTGTLSVNDTIDCIQLTGDGWADGKVVFGTSTSNAFVTVLCRDEKSGECCELDGGLSIFATNGVRDAEIVYSLSQEDVDAGRLFVSVSGYERAGSDKKYGGKSSFDYTVSAYSATTNAGLISFFGQDATVIQTATNQVLQVPLVRFVGSDGSLDITVSLDEAATTATGRYEFAEQTLTWTNGEESVKYVPVTLKGSEFNDGMREIVLSIKENDLLKDVESYYTVYTITYGKEPSDEGQIKVETVKPGAQPDGRIYVRYGTDGSLRSDSTISLLLNRTGGKGPAAAYISWKNGGTSMKETQEWANYETGERKVFMEDGFPEPGKSGYSDVTISVTSSNSVPVVKDGSTLKVRVLPGDAPLFADTATTWSGVQYTTTETNLTSIAIPGGMTVKSLVKISGSVPAGLKVTLVDGKLVVTGTPTAGTVDTTATYWVLLERDGGGRLYSMPVTVTFKNKALADVNDGFVKARSWNSLPLRSDDGTRLAGLLDLTVSKNGKTSARYRMNGGRAVAFSAPGLADVDESGTVSLYAEKSACCGGKWIFGATLGADGSLGATVSQGGGCADEILVGAADIPAGAQQWGTNHTAEVFGGNYVAAFVLDATTNENTLCFGSPAIRLKCDTRSLWNRGAVMFAGTLPNGKNISGTSYLVPVTNNAASATLSVFASSSSDTFAAMVDIDGTALCATPNVIPFWSHDEAGIESLSYKNNYDVIGALWSWAGWSWSGGTVNVNKTSGMASGVISVKLDEKSDRQTRVKWRGFAIPGETPRVLGSCWYDATRPYVDAQGRNRKRTVRVGDAVDLTAAE